MTDHDELMKLALAASRGPWEAGFYKTNPTVFLSWGNGTSAIATVWTDKATAAFIAACYPQAIIRLLDEIAELRKANKQGPTTADSIMNDMLRGRLP